MTRHEHETTAGPATAADRGARQAPFPLTDSQFASWAGGDRSVLGASAQAYLEWQHPNLDVPRFRVAWQRLVEEHAALRTVVRPDGRQQVLDTVPRPPVEVIDLRDSTPAEAEREIRTIRARIQARVLDLEGWPPFEVRLVLLPGGRSRICLKLDPVVADPWTRDDVLLGDLGRWYEDVEAARSQPKASTTFRAYALAVAEPSPEVTLARDYWQTRFAQLPPPPALPPASAALGRLAADPSDPTSAQSDPRDPPDPSDPRSDHCDQSDSTPETGSVGGPFSTETLRFPPALWAHLGRRAAASGLGPEALLIAALAEVLRTWSKNDTFTLALVQPDPLCETAARQRVVGDFATLALLGVDQADGGFVDRARAIHQRLEADRPHRRFGGVQILRELNAFRPAGHRVTLPVQVTNLLSRAPATVPAGLGELVYRDVHPPHLALDVRFQQQSAALVCDWSWSRTQFPPGLVASMYEAYQALLLRLAEADANWAAPWFDLVPAPQLDQRARINETDGPIPDTLLQVALAEQAVRRPDSVAVIAPDRELTYRELASLANRIGRRLRRLGARPGRLVAIVMAKGWAQVAAVYGTLISGGAYLPVDVTVPTERLHFLLANGQVETVLTTADVDAALDWPPQVRRLLVEEDFGDEPDGPLQPVQRSTDTAYVIFTSGSTGVPKGVEVDHRGALNTILDVNHRFEIAEQDRCLAVSGLHFDLSVYDLFGVVQAGGSIVVPPPAAHPDPDRWSRAMQAAGVTVWNSVPALLEMLVTHLETTGEGRRIERLRLVILAGDWIPVTLPDRLRALSPAVRVIASGGPAETCIWSVIYPVEAVDPRWVSIPYGRPMTNQRYHVLDRRLAPRPVWVPGEIFIASEVGLAKGYWDDPERTGRQFLTLPRTGERAYASGDLGRYLPDGNIEILGREDFQVKLQGVRVELGEIEAVLGTHEHVRHAVVVAGSNRDVPVLHAFVVLDGHRSSAAAAGELRAFLTAKLPSYLVPAQISVLKTLPLTSNGKVDRGALTARASTGTGMRDRPAAGPLSEVERTVRRLWSDILGVPKVRSADDFFGLGGDSLTAVVLAARVQAETGVRLSPAAVLRAPTAAEYSTLVRNAQSAL
jgi:amino acid adenylation domain-containing protein